MSKTLAPVRERPARVHVDIPPDVLLLWEQREDEVVKVPDPVLREIAKPVDRPTNATRQLVDRMKAQMATAHGVGLAAPQLGVLERGIIYKLPEEEEPL